MSSKTILIVGGAGFVGSHVNKMLQNHGYQTVVFDNLSLGDRRTILKGEFFQGDMASVSDLEKAFSKYSFDAVMHFAALIDVGESLIKPADYYRNNVANTLNLLEIMGRHSVKNFIFSSSAAIFGMPKEKLISETHPCDPINPYGETKLIVEKMLRDFGHAYGIKSSCLRYFNAAGGDPEGEIKNFKKKETNLIPIILRSLKSKSSVTIFGTDYPTPDGSCIRDYVHVNDLGAAHITAMEHLFKNGTSTFYNLGNGQGYSVKEVIYAVEKITGLKVNSVEGARRPGDPPILVADSQKAHQELEWVPKYKLEEMIEHSWMALE